MKKLLTLALALALVALGSVSWAATSLNSSRGTQKKPPDTAATNLNSSRSNIYRVKVTKVNPKDNTFAVEVNFSVAKPIPLPTPRPPSGTGVATQEALPAIGDVIDVTYTQTTAGGPLKATTIKGSKSNSSERLAAGQDPRLSLVTGKVTKVSEKDKTFAVEVTFSAKNLNAPLPEVGKIIDVTFNPTTPGGPLEATTINGSKSNNY